MRERGIMLKKRLYAVVLIFAVLMCACGEKNKQGNLDQPSGVSGLSETEKAERYAFLLEFTYYWTADGIPGYSYPELEPELEPEYVIRPRGKINAGCDKIELELVELNGKHFCYYNDIYILERKNSEGDWEFIDYKKDHVLYFESTFAGNLKQVAPNAFSFPLFAESHGLDEGFEPGEYRVTKTAVCLVNGEERQTIVTGEFIIE